MPLNQTTTNISGFQLEIPLKSPSFSSRVSLRTPPALGLCCIALSKFPAMEASVSEIRRSMDFRLFWEDLLGKRPGNRGQIGEDPWGWRKSPAGRCLNRSWGVEFWAHNSRSGSGGRKTSNTCPKRSPRIPSRTQHSQKTCPQAGFMSIQFASTHQTLKRNLPRSFRGVKGTFCEHVSITFV